MKWVYLNNFIQLTDCDRSMQKSDLLDPSERLSKYFRVFMHIFSASWSWQADVQYWPIVLQGHAFRPLSFRHIPLHEHTVMSSLLGICAASSISSLSRSSNEKLSSIFMNPLNAPIHSLGIIIRLVSSQYFM